LVRRLCEDLNPAGQKEPTQGMWDKLIQWLVIEQYLEVERPGERGGGQLKVRNKFHRLLLILTIPPKFSLLEVPKLTIYYRREANRYIYRGR
jgi:hypothetical protein